MPLKEIRAGGRPGVAAEKSSKKLKRTAIPYVRQLSHRLRKVGEKCGVDVMFTAPEKLVRISKACPPIVILGMDFLNQHGDIIDLRYHGTPRFGKAFASEVYAESSAEGEDSLERFLREPEPIETDSHNGTSRTTFVTPDGLYSLSSEVSTVFLFVYFLEKESDPAIKTWLAVLSGGALASPGVTGPANNASVRFLVFGDWGGLPFYPYTTRIQRNLAKTMAVVAAAKRIDFVLSLGDNFYFKGVRSVDDRRFKRTFEDVYSAPSLQVPWLILAGNHDHDGNVSAQIEYSNRSKRWHFPFYYYNKTYQIPGAANHTLDILMLDTVLLCGNTDPEDEESQPVLLNRNEALYNRQFRWINKILAQSEARYVLVAGHYPIYSACSHGTTKCLERDLDPLLQKYRVNAYLAGHDHDLQHIRPERLGWNVEYFVSGCTNFINPSLIHRRSLPRNSLKFAWASVFSYGGFAYMEVAEDSMVITFYDSGGKILHENAMKPRPPAAEHEKSRR
ncbi:tartrate-resistant acid phosphatase type 5-like [Dermacentor variabilis]|uniref:tartrate-resistant acid phosphatase type 5-like n=1 Tax=Dermacentor variabilis TaxID=34621 RepID=UPI003F5B2F3E